MRTSPTARALAALSLFAAVWVVGCTSKTPEEEAQALETRMKDIEKRMKDSMPKTQENALKQKVAAEVVTKVQEELRVLKEYLDEPSGKIDFVTVNAIEAFQRSAGLDDNGLLDEKTLSRLEEAAQKAKGDGRG